jgi:hypothetical protein
MIRRSVPSARASGERGGTVSSPSRRSKAAALDSNNNSNNNRRNNNPGGSLRSSLQLMFPRPAGPTFHMLRLLVAGCFSVSVGIFVVLQLWAAIDWVFSDATLPFFTSSTVRVAFSTPIPFNPLYHAPEAHAVVGDRSDRYAKLRQMTDHELPDNAERSLEFVRELRSHSYQARSMEQPVKKPEEHAEDAADADASTHDDSASAVNDATISVAASAAYKYNVLDCPATPPPGYPFAWNLMEMLDHWPVDDTTPKRPTIHQGLCVFDYRTEYDKAMTYRNAEVPFVVENDPAVAKTTERWNTPGYMERLLGDEEHRTEYSENNFFMYATPVSKKKHGRMRSHTKKVPEGWKEPTSMRYMSYKSWMALANVTDDELGPDKPHWYFRLFGDGVVTEKHEKHSSDYLFDELPFFQPKQSLYLVEQDGRWGINCRFGMKGVVAASHFDGSRNAVAVLGGSRRYILAHPNQCQNMGLYPMGHPSGRHSAVDWSNPDLEANPEFAQAKANEVVLQPGHVLYLPTDWFHFIVSLELTFQCNSRSGVGDEYKELMQQCGFV